MPFTTCGAYLSQPVVHTFHNLWCIPFTTCAFTMFFHHFNIRNCCLAVVQNCQLCHGVLLCATLSLPTLKMLISITLLKMTMQYNRHFCKAYGSPQPHPSQCTLCTLVKMMSTLDDLSILLKKGCLQNVRNF